MENVYRADMSLSDGSIEIRESYSELCHEWGLINLVKPYTNILSTWVSANDIDAATNKAMKNFEKYQGGKLKMSEEIKNNNNDVVEENIEESNTEEKVNDTISLTLSNGESYVIANSSFDWGSMISNLDSLYGNLHRINMILSDLVGVTQQKSIEIIADNAIEELAAFGKGVGVNLSHKNSTLTKRETAILMCFDAASIIQMIIRYAEVYNAQIVMNQKHAESNQHVISLLNSLLKEKEEMLKKKHEEIAEMFEPAEDLSEMTAKEYIDKKYSDKNKESDDEPLELVDDPDITPVSESEYAATVMKIDNFSCDEKEEENNGNN